MLKPVVSVLSAIAHYLMVILAIKFTLNYRTDVREVVMEFKDLGTS